MRWFLTNVLLININQFICTWQLSNCLPTSPGISLFFFHGINFNIRVPRVFKGNDKNKKTVDVDLNSYPWFPKRLLLFCHRISSRNVDKYLCCLEDILSSNSFYQFHNQNCRISMFLALNRVCRVVIMFLTLNNNHVGYSGSRMQANCLLGSPYKTILVKLHKNSVCLRTLSVLSFYVSSEQFKSF